MPTTTAENDLDYTLTELTDVDQIRFTRKQNSQSWKGQLSAEKYVEREFVLSKSKIALGDDNKLYVFALHKKNTPNEFLCSIELFVRTSWIFKYNKASGTVEKHDIKSGCIGGVYTYPDYRGKGLARLMVNKLVQISKLKYIGEDGYIFLYSEIGEYYSKCGFKSFEVPLTFISLTIEKESQVSEFEQLLKQETLDVELINYHDFEDVYKIYNKVHESEFIKRTLKDHKSRISISSSSDYIDWFHLRSKFISHQVFQDSQPPINFIEETYEEISEKLSKYVNPNVFGIKLMETSTKKLQGFISWTYDWVLNSSTGNSENYITILSIYVDELEDYEFVSKKLFQLCKSYLQQFDLFKGLKQNDLQKIVLWELEVTSNLLEHFLKTYNGKHGNPNGSMSCALIFDENDNEDLKNGNLIWELNNKLPWF